MEQKKSIEILVDNKAAISITNNSVSYGKTKHFKLKLYTLREVKRNGDINVVHCRTDFQNADILTKSLPRSRKEFLRGRLGVTTLESKRSVKISASLLVTCNSKRQRVVAFVLPDLQLRGTISLSLANLSFLRVLNLENNSFHGSVPYELGHLPHLRVIDIQNNQLQGSIPTSLFQHQRVQIISLAFNELSGEMWNGPWYVPELRVLNLSNNSLINIIPPAVGNATKLLNFSLSGNKINGNIPKEMSSIPATLFNISSLLTISLSFNSLSGPLMLDEENIVSNLKIISLAKNKFSGCISSNICQLTELKVLSLPFNNITGKIPKNIGCLSKLKMFYIGQILKAIFNISTLEAIAFSFNNLSGRIPTTTGLHHIKFLLLGNNQIEGEIPLFIANASTLEILELANNFLTGTIPINLGNLQEQQILILHDNLPTNELRECELRFFNSLTDCRILQYLDVGSNLLNGVLPNSIGNLSSTIELIHLGDAHISGFIPTSIGNMSGLSALVFQQNHLMGNIPPEIGPILLSFVNLIILEFLGSSLNALSEVYVECTYWRFSLPGKELKSNKLVLKIVIPAIVSIFLISLLVSIWIMKQPKKGKSKDVEQAPEIRTHQLVSYHEI
ncbi:probable leucine-rich repeat receptor-like protein kinase At5g63930 [Capsicum annuum]|uniref:probable leucine-rich repeat receptor-like protein kinase At5g63930 n=1 Tax=Capsicum annuum TaxID=4072 RepID=UPI001FB0FF02|nr:probable leucine-rich repeat receptor-like protein kinase At5g63930 [Capsicum annuum]